MNKTKNDLDELEKKVISVLAELPVHQIVSTRWHELARSYVQIGFMLAKRAIERPQEK